MTIEETFKKHPVYKGMEVSTEGTIKRNGKVMPYTETFRGYRYVAWTEQGIHYNKQIGRLVLETYKDNPDNLPCCGHWDDNPRNNSVDNVYWTDYKENNNHNDHNKKVSMGMQIPVTKILNGEEVDFFHGAIEAEKETGISKSHIAKVCRGKRKSAGGYMWEYSQTLF